MFSKHITMKLLLLFWLFLTGLSTCIGQNTSDSLILVDGQAVTLENLLQRYIRIPSVSGNEKEAGDFIKKVCEENGLFISNFGEENGNYNFAASIRPLDKNKPNLVFLNHIDVVPSSEDEGMNGFSGRIENGKVYGRGAIDNKGAAVMQLAAVIRAGKLAQKNDLQFNVTFLAVSCEETQCGTGVSYVIKNYLEILNPATVIGEGPTELSTLIPGKFKNHIFGVSLAHKRTMWLNLTLAVETAGHGSVTPLSYANKDMVEALERVVTKKQKLYYNDINTGILKTFGEHKKGIEKLVLSHPKFFKPLLVGKLRAQPELFSIFSNTITLTNINSSPGAHNQIAPKVVATLDCRLLPDADEQAFIENLKKVLDNNNINVSIENISQKTGFSEKNNIYYYNLEKAIKLNYTDAHVMPIILPNMNDLGAFRVKGIPCYATIPTYVSKEQVESIHNKDENIDVKSLYNGAQVYYDFIELMEKIK